MMMGRDIIVIGASAGGVDAIPRLIGSLPANLPAAVFVVLHIPAQGRDLMPEIIRRATSLSVAHGVDGERIRNWKARSKELEQHAETICKLLHTTQRD